MSGPAFLFTMIRESNPNDLEQMLAIWLDASCLAHSFIPSSFWESKQEDMRNLYLPSTTNWVYVDEKSGKVKGFISISGNYIPALFVDPAVQGKGIGCALLEQVKKCSSRLILNVYAENERAIRFYQKQGFILVGEDIEEHTGHKEFMMEYILPST